MSDVRETDLRDRIVDRLGVLLREMLGRELPDISADTRLLDELGLSSARTFELLLVLEDDLDMEVDVDEIEQRDLASLGSLADFVAARTAVDE